MEHENCKPIFDIEEAAGNIYSKPHVERINKSVLDLSKHFKDIKSAAEIVSHTLLLHNKNKTDVDELKQAKNALDDYPEKEDASLIADTDQNIQADRNALDAVIRVCEASICSLTAKASHIEKTKSVGNEGKMFIAVHRATRHTKQYCDVLLELNRELLEMNVKLGPNVTLPDKFKSLGTVSVETSKVTDVSNDTVPIYTGEIMVKCDDDNKVPVVWSFDVLQDGRKLVLDMENDRMKLYDKTNTFVTEIVLPAKQDERYISVVLNNNNEALVTTDAFRVFKVTIGDTLTASETKTKYRIYAMTKYGDNILCVLHDGGQWQICIVDENIKNVKRTLLKDDGTLFSAPMFIGVRADQDNIYVLDNQKGCYGITLDGNIVFHYQNPEAMRYLKLAIDRDGLFIGTAVGNKVLVERLDFRGERQEVFTSINNAYPLRMEENELAVYQLGEGIGFYRFLK